MSQAMNFSPDVKLLEGGELPTNSVTLVYSPSCPHCHNILPQYNQLANLSGGKFSVNAVNLMDHYHTLRAGGIEVGGVPQILIRGGGSEILEYGGPRMAESISREAVDFISSGKLSGGRVFGRHDALLGGSIDTALKEIEGGKRSRHRRRRMGGGADLEGGRRSRSRSRSRRSRSRRSHRRLGGGATDSAVAAAVAEVIAPVLEGGRRRRRSMRGGEDVSLSGGKRRRSAWVNHVMAYAKKHNIPYGEAMTKARASWKSKH